MEGPFAEKLDKALKGHDIPRVSREPVIVTEGLDLSGGGKSGRQKGRERHERREKREKHDGEGVSGRSVHTRGQFLDSTRSEPALESSERQELKRLFTDVSLQSEALTQLNAFLEANNYKETDGEMMEAVAARLEEANRIVGPFFGEASDLSPTPADVESLRGIRERFAEDIADVKEALEELEKSEQLIIPADVKSLFETPSVQATPEKTAGGPIVTKIPNGEGERAPEKRSYASYSEEELRATWGRLPRIEMIETVEAQLKEWENFDQKIRTFKSQERVVSDLRDTVPKEKIESTLSLTGRNEEVTATLKDIRERFEKSGAIDKRDAGKLTALFFDYHRLLVAAERVVQERERETPIVTRENEKRVKKSAEEKLAREKAAEAAAQVVVQAGAPERVATVEQSLSFEEKLSKLTDLLGRWNALTAEFNTPEFSAAMARVRKNEIPPIKNLEGWLAKKTTPESWSKQDRKYIEVEVLPEMERLIRQAEKATKKLREVSSVAAEKVVLAEPKEPVAQVLGLDGRVIERDETGELNQTEWQRMNPVEQNRLRNLLFQKRNEYLTRANATLKKSGIERAVDRQKLVRERLEAFMLKVIEKEITTVKLMEADRQSLVRELSKETDAFFAQ